MTTHKKPDKATIGKFAERSPHLLNPLVAFFVLGWRKVFLAVPMHGVDQTGKMRLLPDYVMLWGIDECVHELLKAPDVREGEGTDGLSLWLAANI